MFGTAFLALLAHVALISLLSLYDYQHSFTHREWLSWFCMHSWLGMEEACLKLHLSLFAMVTVFGPTLHSNGSANSNIKHNQNLSFNSHIKSVARSTFFTCEPLQRLGKY